MTPTQGPYPINIKGGEIWVIIQPIHTSLLLGSEICIRGAIIFQHSSILAYTVIITIFYSPPWSILELLFADQRQEVRLSSSPPPVEKFRIEKFTVSWRRKYFHFAHYFKAATQHLKKERSKLLQVLWARNVKKKYFIEFKIQVYCMQHYTVNKKKIEKQTDLLKGNAKMQILHKSYSIIAGITDQLSLRLITQQLHNSLQIYWNYWKGSYYKDKQ